MLFSVHLTETSVVIGCQHCFDDPNVFYQCIDGDLVFNATFQRAFCGAVLLAKTGISSVCVQFGSCNGHVTAITSDAELNVKEKFLLLFCCYCSTLQHCLP